MKITEAGKLALNSTKGSINLGRIQVAPRKGMRGKVFAIKANQFLGQKLPTVTSRGPNILKRSPVDNKAGKVLITTISNTTTVPTISECSNSVSPSEVKFIYFVHVYARQDFLIAFISLFISALH